MVGQTRTLKEIHNQLDKMSAVICTLQIGFPLEFWTKFLKTSISISWWSADGRLAKDCKICHSKYFEQPMFLFSQFLHSVICKGNLKYIVVLAIIVLYRLARILNNQQRDEGVNGNRRRGIQSSLVTFFGNWREHIGIKLWRVRPQIYSLMRTVSTTAGVYSSNLFWLMRCCFLMHESGKGKSGMG